MQRGSKTVCIGGRGPRKAPIAIIGEAPGRKEDETGEPFVGASGKMLDQLLKEAGISRSKVFVTNTVRCRSGENSAPSILQITMCRGYLLKELEFVQPAAILCLGRTAAVGLMPNFNAHIGEAQYFIGVWKKIPVYLAYHPAAIVRNTILFGVAVETFKKVKSETESRLKVSLC